MKNKNINLNKVQTEDLIRELWGRDDIVVIQSYTKKQLEELLETKENIEEFMSFLNTKSYLADQISIEIKDDVYKEFLESVDNDL